MILSFSDPSNISLTPFLPIVNVSYDAILTCEGFGVPLPTLNWYSNRSIDEGSGLVNSGSGDDEMNFQLFNTSGTIEITTDTRLNTEGRTVSISVLRIISVEKSDRSVSYRCEGINGITNDIGAINDRTVILTVQGNEIRLILLL